MQTGHFSFYSLLSFGLFFQQIQKAKTKPDNLFVSKTIPLLFVSRLNMMIHSSYGMCNRTIFHFDKI